MTSSLPLTVERIDSNHAAPVPARYSELKRVVSDAGLLEKQPFYYSWKITLLFGLLACSVAFLFVTRSLPLQLLNAAVFAFVFGQLGLLGHDAGHNQIFRQDRWNTFLGRLCGNLVLGMGLDWWRNHHNAHHGKPNQEGFDPDADIPLLAFTSAQALRRRGFAKWCMQNQAYIMPFMACFQVFDLHHGTVEFLIKRRSRSPYVESALLVAHVVFFGGVLFYTQGILQGLLFILVQRVISGVYLAAIFAPNHTAMPVLTAEEQMDFLLQQVLTSRNVRPPRPLSFLFGGLHLQIEHHLFPTMPRNQLRRAQPIIRAFCEQNGISYKETRFLKTYADIFRHMWQVSHIRPGLA